VVLGLAGLAALAGLLGLLGLLGLAADTSVRSLLLLKDQGFRPSLRPPWELVFVTGMASWGSFTEFSLTLSP